MMLVVRKVDGRSIANYFEKVDDASVVIMKRRENTGPEEQRSILTSEPAIVWCAPLLPRRGELAGQRLDLIVLQKVTRCVALYLYLSLAGTWRS